MDELLLDLDDISVPVRVDLDSIDLPEPSSRRRETEDEEDPLSLDFDTEDLLTRDMEDIVVPDDLLDLEDVVTSIAPVAHTIVPAKTVISEDQSLEIYCDKLVRMLDWAKSSHLSSQTAMVELSRRLTKYYNDNNNNIVPVVDFDRQEGGATPASFILTSVRNRVPVSTIIEGLRDKFSNQRILKSDGNYFKFQGTAEARVRDFIVQIKNFYEAELAVFEQNSTSLAVSDSFTDMSRYITSTKDLILKENPTAYPTLIDLGRRTFVCGSCGETVEFTLPFIRASLTNSDNDDWFFLLMPTLECCTECGTANMLPANYFEKISVSLKSSFNSGPIEDLKDQLRSRLRELCGKFKVSQYDLSPETIMSAVTPDMSHLFKVGEPDNVIKMEDTDKYVFDYKSSSSLYKEMVKSLSSPLSRSNKQFMYTEDVQLTDEVLANFRSSFVRVLCDAVGSDYTALKKKAINSLIYFIEDTIPYVANPYSTISVRCDFMLGQMDKESYENALAQYNQSMENFIKYRDLFSFVPLLRATTSHSKYKHYSSDEKMRSFLDYCSDNMILYSLREDIMSLSRAEKVLRPILTKSKNLPLDIKKLQEQITRGNQFHMNMAQTIKNFVYTKFRNLFGLDYSTVFRYMSNKDLYNLAKCVFESSEEFDENSSHAFMPDITALRENLEQFRARVENETRAEFYYGDLFTKEELQDVDISGIDIPVSPPREDLDCKEYFTRIKTRKTLRSGKNTLKGSEWFDENVDNYFDLLSKFLLKDVKIEDALFMDVMKALACNEISDVLAFFGISVEVAKMLLSSSDYFSFAKIDPEVELAKMIVCEYPYADDDLKLVISSCDPANVYEALLEEMDNLTSELKEAPLEIREVIEAHLPIALSEVE